jgi:hypothetical protein
MTIKISAMGLLIKTHVNAEAIAQIINIQSEI